MILHIVLAGNSQGKKEWLKTSFWLMDFSSCMEGVIMSIKKLSESYSDVTAYCFKSM